MKNEIRYYYEQLSSRLIRKFILEYYGESKYYSKTRKCFGDKVYNANDISDYITSMIIKGDPFLVSRFGSTELQCCSIFDMNISKKKTKAMNQLCNWSGFFPNNICYGKEFSKLILNCCKDIDILGMWNLPFEKFYIKKLMSRDIKLANIRNIEPWMADNPWTSALISKKVLIVHPFETTINHQYYNNRKKIFSKNTILPEFNIITYRSVQTIAGQRDDRFQSWFEALDFMTDEIKHIDFDIAILGCGAYGLPLACRIKNMGKQAIHLGGVTQILFGIKGRRWEKDKAVSGLFNEYWVNPREDERPREANSVENGCYW